MRKRSPEYLSSDKSVTVDFVLTNDDKRSSHGQKPRGKSGEPESPPACFSVFWGIFGLSQMALDSLIWH